MFCPLFCVLSTNTTSPLASGARQAPHFTYSHSTATAYVVQKKTRIKFLVQNGLYNSANGTQVAIELSYSQKKTFFRRLCSSSFTQPTYTTRSLNYIYPHPSFFPPFLQLYLRAAFSSLLMLFVAVGAAEPDDEGSDLLVVLEGVKNMSSSSSSSEPNRPPPELTGFFAGVLTRTENMERQGERESRSVL